MNKLMNNNYLRADRTWYCVYENGLIIVITLQSDY